MEDEIEYDEDYNCDEYNDQEIYDKNNDNIYDNMGQSNENSNPIIDYEIIKDSEIIKKRDIIINKFIECSCLSYDESELVLMNFNWDYDKLIDIWFDDTEKIKQESHIEQSPDSLEAISKFIGQNNITKDTCPICFCEIEKDNSISLKCNHYICKECFVEYVNNKLETDPMNILYTSCPLNGCNLYLTRTIYKKCITEKKMQKLFARSVIFNFIKTNKNIKICPNPSCNYSIKVKDNIEKEIKCKCGFIFCFLCFKESHIPCSCEMVKQWKILYKEMSKRYEKIFHNTNLNIKDVEYMRDFTWINDNTKNCPKCNTPIEKNQGCNHMVCTCKYEFCWNCLGNWFDHENCYSKKYLNRINKKKYENKKLTNQLDIFLDYFKGYKTQKIKSNFIDKLKDKIEDFKEDLIEKKNLLDGDLIFLDEALETIINCNRLLKYIFIFGYYLNKDANITLFEYNYQFLQHQNDLLLESIELDKLPSIMKIIDYNLFKKMFLEYKDNIFSLIKLIYTYKNNLINEINNNLFDKIDYQRISDFNI